MKLTIIDKYIAKELLLVFLSVYFVLLLIVLSTEVVHLLKWVSQGVIPLSAFISYLANSFFEFSVVLIPLSLLMGILLAFGRLYSDSEMAAIMSAGIGPLQWYRPLMLVAIPITLILFLLLAFVKPVINYQRAQLHAEIRSQSKLDTLMVGQFNRAKSIDGVLFLESPPGELKNSIENNDTAKNDAVVDNIFFQQFRQQTSYVDLAQGISSLYNDEGRRYVVMHKGIHYVGNAGDADFKIIKYEEYGVHINKKSIAPHQSVKSKPFIELWQSTEPAEQAELQWRITLPIATLIVAFMALPLSHTNPRSGRYSKLAVSLIIYLLYSNLLGVGKTWIVQEKVPVWIGTWWVHLIAIIFTLILLKHYGYLTGIRQKTVSVRNDS